MIRRAVDFLSVEARGINSAVYVLAAFALLSSLLALLRDRLLANAFGAGVELDIYYAAFRIPDFLFVAIGALVSVYVLIPELSRREFAEQKKYIDTVFLGFSILAVCAGGVALILAPAILKSLFPHFEAAGLLPALISLTRIMLLQPILLGLSNIFAAITQIKFRYTLYAASPLFYNLGIILGIAVFYPMFGLSGLAWGVVLGAALHAGIQVPSILKDGFFRDIPRFSQARALVDTMAVSVPRALALSMNQITFIGLTALAATLAAGSISVFMFAVNLYSVPLAIIGASYSVAAFPALALALAKGLRSEFVEKIAAAARHVLFWSLPATALIIVLRAHIVRVVLGSGAFDWTDTRLTAASFAILSLSLACQGLMLLLVRGYYAAGRTLVPILVSMGIALGTIGLGGLLTRFFESAPALSALQSLMRLEEIPGSNMLALSIAYAVAMLAGTAVLALFFERRFRGFISQISRSIKESMISALAGGAAAYAALAFMDPIVFSSTLASVFVRGFVAGVCGIIISAFAYSLFKNAEYQETLAAVRGRLWRGTIKTQSGTSIVASAEESAELK